MANNAAFAGLGQAIGEGANAYAQAKAAKNAALLNQQKIEAEQNKDTITPEMAQAFAKANGQNIDLSMFAGQRVPAAILRPMGMYGAANVGGNAKVKAAEIGAQNKGMGQKADKDTEKMITDITTELGAIQNARQQAKAGGLAAVVLISKCNKNCLGKFRKPGLMKLQPISNSIIS